MQGPDVHTQTLDVFIWVGVFGSLSPGCGRLLPMRQAGRRLWLAPGLTPKIFGSQ